MNSFGFVDKQKSYLVAAFALLVAFIAPSIVFAAQVTERSVALSSSSAGADNVTYKVNFNAKGSADTFIVDFCANSPLIGSACDTPDAGFSVGSAASSSSGVTAVAGSGHQVLVTRPITAGDVSVDITGINNPDTAGPLYARILTFTGTNASGYTSTAPGTHVDDGGVAMSITPTIGVSGAVLESLTFCVSGQAIAANCIGGGAAAPALTAPTLKLGADVGGVIALDSQLVYTGTVETQISTNAVSGAIISLKSNRTGCGGLVRAGAASNAAGCGIAPATDSSDITAGQAKFGVRTGTATGVANSGANGTLQPYDADGAGAGTAFYSSSVYRMGYVAGDGTGVTSTYGDPILDTNSAPVNNMGMPLTFAASAANDTAAGLYSADLSLIATGRF